MMTTQVRFVADRVDAFVLIGVVGRTWRSDGFIVTNTASLDETVDYLASQSQVLEVMLVCFSLICNVFLLFDPHPAQHDAVADAAAQRRRRRARRAARSSGHVGRVQCAHDEARVRHHIVDELFADVAQTPDRNLTIGDLFAMQLLQVDGCGAAKARAITDKCV